MSDLVSAETIESIVGIKRHATDHLGRAVSGTEIFYILHSQHCVESHRDLRDCEYSLALDNGIDPDEWANFEDQVVRLAIDAAGYALVPPDEDWVLVREDYMLEALEYLDNDGARGGTR